MSNVDLPQVTITTDGAARGNPGPGGWAALLEVHRSDGTIAERMVEGAEPQKVTNNAMETMAVAGGLAALKKPCRVLLRIDSQYVISGIERLQRGWTPLPEMQNGVWWCKLADALGNHEITVEWVRGHAGDVRNERVDAAATAAANRAYDEVEAIRRTAEPAPTGAWQLFIRTGGGGRPVEWLLRTLTDYEDGTIPVRGGVTEPTAAWMAVVAGLEAVHSREPSAQQALVITTNLEMIVKQCRGEWKAKQPEQRALYQEALGLIGALGDVQYAWQRTEALIEAMNA